MADIPENLENLTKTREVLEGLRLELATITEQIETLSDTLFGTGGSVIKADGSVPFDADESMGGNKLTDVDDPEAGTDAANKDYVDNLIGNLGLLPLAVVNQASGSLSPGGSATPLPNSDFSFSLSALSVVAVDVCLFQEAGSQAPDSSTSCTFAIENTDSLVSIDAWLDQVQGNASGNPAWSGTIGFPGVKRTLLTLAAGDYNFRITARVSAGAFTLTYPLSIIVTLVG